MANQTRNKASLLRTLNPALIILLGAAFFLCMRLGRKNHLAEERTGAPQGASVRNAAHIQKQDVVLAAGARALSATRAETRSDADKQFVADETAAPVRNDVVYSSASADSERLARLGTLLDDDRDSEALRVAGELLKSSDEAVRRKAVDGLGWIGLSAFPELTEALGDSADSVSEDAFEQWMQQADELEGTETLATFLNAAMETLADSERLERVVMLYDRLSDDVAVRNLALVISSTTEQNASVARDHYEFITSEPFTTLQAAETWIQENVETATE